MAKQQYYTNNVALMNAQCPDNGFFPWKASLAGHRIPGTLMLVLMLTRISHEVKDFLKSLLLLSSLVGVLYHSLTRSITCGMIQKQSLIPLYTCTCLILQKLETVLLIYLVGLCLGICSVLLFVFAVVFFIMLIVRAGSNTPFINLLFFTLITVGE